METVRHDGTVRSWGTIEQSLRTALAPELEIVRKIGGGNSTAVFLAREPALQRLVAIKVLRPIRSHQEKARARFIREATSIARISHPNVISLYRIDTVLDEVPYVAMQYVRGQSLAVRLQSEDPLPLEDARRILLGVASALQAAHARGILHRDLNPSNILLEEDTGQVFLTDFGLALLLQDDEESSGRITTQGHVIGNLRYLSPEQVRGEKAGELSDVWGLGVLAWEILAGRGPFDRDSVAATMRASLLGDAPRLDTACPGIPGSYADLFDRCLALNPENRPTASEIVGELAEPGVELPFRVVGGGTEERSSTRGTVDGSADAVAEDPSAHQLSLRLLGGLELEATDGRKVSSILSQPKRVALLVLLACGSERGLLRRDRLIGLLWPELDQDRGRHALRQSLYVLRKALGHDLVEARGDDEVGLRRDVVSCDAMRFEREAIAGNAESAMETYGGDLLPGFFLHDAVEFERWLEAERLRLRRIAASCCWRLAEQYEAGGDEVGCSKWARRAVDLAPFDEGAVHRLIELLDRIGNRAGALSAFDHFARRLGAEYAAEPSPETKALIDRVRARN
jgi:DNA-binding SARP family transcriptional activator/tRNA A-37 threonylcarbamoyl transferase component Bud32